jgi:hypothetical protein
VNLYSQEVREFIHSRNWPSGLKFEVRQNDEPEPHLNIIFYRDNWITLSFDAQMQTTEIVKEVMHKLHADGIPTYVGKIERAEA